MTLRQQLVEEKWRPDLVERCIPLSDGIKPLDLLTGQYLALQWDCVGAGDPHNQTLCSMLRAVGEYTPIIQSDAP
jgi:hypothetical protein